MFQKWVGVPTTRNEFIHHIGYDEKPFTYKDHVVYTVTVNRFLVFYVGYPI